MKNIFVTLSYGLAAVGAVIMLVLGAVALVAGKSKFLI